MSLYSFDSFFARIKKESLFEKYLGLDERDYNLPPISTTPFTFPLWYHHPIHSSGLLCAILQGQRQCHGQLFASLPGLAARQNFPQTVLLRDAACTSTNNTSHPVVFLFLPSQLAPVRPLHIGGLEQLPLSNFAASLIRANLAFVAALQDMAKRG